MFPFSDSTSVQIPPNQCLMFDQNLVIFYFDSWTKKIGIFVSVFPWDTYQWISILYHNRHIDKNAAHWLQEDLADGPCTKRTAADSELKILGNCVISDNGDQWPPACFLRWLSFGRVVQWINGFDTSGKPWPTAYIYIYIPLRITCTTKLPCGKLTRA